MSRQKLASIVFAALIVLPVVYYVLGYMDPQSAIIDDAEPGTVLLSPTFLVYVLPVLVVSIGFVVK